MTVEEFIVILEAFPQDAEIYQIEDTYSCDEIEPIPQLMEDGRVRL